MSYEKIDEGVPGDGFDDIVIELKAFIKVEAPEIQKRLELERTIKKYLKCDNPDLILNFILATLDSLNNDDLRQQEKTSRTSTSEVLEEA